MCEVLILSFSPENGNFSSLSLRLTNRALAHAGLLAISTQEHTRAFPLRCAVRQGMPGCANGWREVAKSMRKGIVVVLSLCALALAAGIVMALVLQGG